LKPTLKIHITDFWPNFDYHDNFFLRLLSKKYQIVHSPEDPDIVLYSCYGVDYRRYKCLRIFFSSENVRPDFAACDFAITFDHNDNPRHHRWPLYGYYLDQYGALDRMGPRTREQAEAIWRGKKKFCCMVVSNGHAKKRIEFFKQLSRHRQVDSGGRFLNNVGGPVKDKLEFIRDYKFVIAFENSSRDGYTTEKLLEPLIMDCIPVYWGNPRVGEDFNTAAFLDHSNFAGTDELIAKMLEIDSDPEQAIRMIMEPRFPDGSATGVRNDEELLKFFEHVIDTRTTVKPVATTFKRYVHSARRKTRIAWSYLLVFLHLNYR